MVIKEVTDLQAHVQSGGVIAFPTDTVYGLGCDANNNEALAKIYELKQRPRNKPLILFVSSQAQVSEFAEVIPPIAQKLMTKFWPGALTIVLPKKKHVSDAITAGLPSVGLRMPNHSDVLALLGECGCPLATTSANISGAEASVKASEVASVFPSELPILAGVAQGQVASTVIEITRENNYKILRSGAIATADIVACLGEEV